MGVKALFETHIEKNEILEPSTRAKAILKLSKIGVKMGYPDKVLVIHLSADKKGALNFALEPYAPFLREYCRDSRG